MAGHGPRGELPEPAGRRRARQGLPDVPGRAERAGRVLRRAEELPRAVVRRVRPLTKTDSISISRTQKPTDSIERAFSLHFNYSRYLFKI